MCIRPLILKVFPTFVTTTKVSSANDGNTSRTSKRSNWGARIGSTFKGSKSTNTASTSSKISTTRSADGRKITSESKQVINLQPDSESERDLQDIELEERGESRSGLERIVSGSNYSSISGRDARMHEEPNKV